MPTTLRERAVGESLIHRTVRVLATELSDASATQVVDLFDLPAGAWLVESRLNNVEAATDSGSISALTAQVGVTGVDTDAFIPAYDLFGDEGYVDIDGAGTSSSGVTVSALFTATGANLGDGDDTGLDTGIFDFEFLYYKLKV